jgi:hypothetical protein
MLYTIPVKDTGIGMGIDFLRYTQKQTAKELSANKVQDWDCCSAKSL